MSKNDKRDKNREFGPWQTAVFALWGIAILANFLPFRKALLDYLAGLPFFSEQIPGAPIPGIAAALFRHTFTIASAFAVMVAGYGFGKLFFNKFLQNFRETNMFIYYFGFGQGILIMALLCIGYLHLLYPVVIYGLIALGIILCLRDKNEIHFSGMGSAVKFKPLEKLLLLLLASAAAVNLIGALTPEIYYDSLVYHLAIPEWWLQNHRISTIPFINQSYYPLNMETLFTAALALSNSSAAKMVNWFFALATCALIYETAFLLTKKRAIAIFSAMIFYSTPLLMMQTWKTGNEIGQGLWELLMIFTLLKYLQNKNRIFLALSGAAMGLSLGAKHPATMAMLSVTLAFWLWHIVKIKLKPTVILKKYAIFLAFATLTAGPWYLRTLILTGNPLFPQFAGKISDFRGDLREEFDTFTTDQAHVTAPKKILTALWDVTMGKYQGAHPGPVYLLLTMLVLLKAPLNKHSQFLLLYLLPYTFLWITVGGSYLRRFLPGLTSVAVLFGTYLAIIESGRGILKNVTKLLLAALIASNIHFAFLMLVKGHGALNYVSGMEDKYSYIRRPLMGHPKYSGEIFRYINTELPEDAVILFVSETRPFYAERQYIWGTAVLGQNPIVEWANESNSVEELYSILRENGVSHIFFSLAERRRLKVYKRFYWSDGGRRVFQALWERYVELEYQSDYSYLYRITETKQTPTRNLILASD